MKKLKDILNTSDGGMILDYLHDLYFRDSPFTETTELTAYNIGAGDVVRDLLEVKNGTVLYEEIE